MVGEGLQLRNSENSEIVLIFVIVQDFAYPDRVCNTKHVDSGNSEICQFRNSRSPQGLHSQARAIANKLTRPAQLEDISCDKQALHGLRAVGEVVSGSLRLGARMLKRCCRRVALTLPARG